MRTSILAIALAGLAALAAQSAKPLAAADFPLSDGDVWVMAGDSITAQHLHSNYFEAFCYARYPKLKFAFRNSGVGGHTIPSTLARFEYDIAAWKPTVVSVELGMNDSGGTPTEQFIANMGGMLQRIRGIKARPVILAASPVNDGTTMARLAGRNVRLDEYAKALKAFAAKEEVPYADQFHALIDLWGQNKPRETLANALPALRQAATDGKLAGIEHLRAFLADQDKSPGRLVSMQGDAVHPGPPGQLLMAAALLKALGAEVFVSSATLDASGKVMQSKGCQIENVSAAEDGRGLQFQRLDERLWFPIPEDARAAAAIDPTPFELSQYTLKVTGLKPGSYAVQINGIAVATVSDTALARGINLTEFGPQPGAKGVSPIIAQSKAILDAVAAKEAIVSQWRGLSQRAHAAGGSPDLKEQLAALTKKVEEADGKIRAAAEPKKLKFEIAAAAQ